MTTLQRMTLVVWFSVSATAGAAPHGKNEPQPEKPEATPSSPLSDPPPTIEVAKPEGVSSSDDLTELSLDELANVNVLKVTSVAGVSRSFQSTPAAMYVITGDDIRRSGHHNVAEALRMVPGLAVSHITSNVWSISSRGFSSQYANKLLVLIDGRAVYSPEFGGVYWDVQNLPIDDIERIEVIRGPGATLWGANAVNGVINVITKSAKDTQGGLITAGVGDELRGLGSFRYGGKLNDHAFVRVYGMFDSWDTLTDSFGHSAHDDWEISQGGTRFDWEGKDGYTLTLQGDAYGSGHVGERVFRVFSIFPLLAGRDIDDQVVGGGNVLLRWGRKSSETSGWSLQAYYDRTEREDIISGYDLNTYDLTLNHYFSAGERHSLIWGLGVRHWDDESQSTPTVFFRPASRSDDIFSAFVQDTIELVRKRLFLMVGSKFERNDYSGLEIQPSARLSWTPNDDHTLWTAVSRAVRTPVRTDSDINAIYGVIPFPVAIPLRITGNKHLDAEQLVAYEVGYRVKPVSRLTLDWAAFFHDYEDLIGAGPSGTGPFDITYGNNHAAETYGHEIAATWEATDHWKLNLGYAWLREDLHGGDELAEDNEPRNTASLRSDYEVTPTVQLHSALYYVDSRRAADVPSYLRLDVGVTWQIKKNVEFSLWGQNLIDDHHPEFIDAYALPARPSEVDRGVYALVRIKF